MEPFQEIIEVDHISGVIKGVSELNMDDILDFVHADDKDPEQYVEAIMEDINDVVIEVYNAMDKVDSESEQEVKNLVPGDAAFNSPDEVHEQISSLGPAIMHSDFANTCFGHHEKNIVAYENLLTVSMKTKHEEQRHQAETPKVWLGI